MTSYNTVSHPTLWFEDGNILLRAEGVLFKVYKGFLCKQSSVFADMLSLPQPSTAAEDLCDGCPIVRMSDSSAALEVFLSAMFDYEYVSTIRGRPVLATLLSISHKYHALSIWRRAIKALQDDFPDTAEDFMKIRKAAQPTATFDWEFYSAVLREAQKAEARVLLPAAFLQVMAQPLASIINAPQLDEEDRKAIIILRDDVAKLSRTGLFNVVRVSTSYTAVCCSYSWDCLRQEIYTVDTFHDPFNVILGFQKRGQYAFRKCPSCHREAALSHCDAALNNFWFNLPDTLGLPGWYKLREAARGGAGVTIK